MDRGETGRYEVTTFSGEEVRAVIAPPAAVPSREERENRHEPASPQGPAPATTTVGFGARPAMPGSPPS